MSRPKSAAPKTYESLPQTKSKNGYVYNLVKRSAKAAIYEQIVEKEINGEIGEKVGYEVFLISVGKAYSLVQKCGKKKGQVYSYPAAEKFASNEDFGKTAWAFNTMKAAMEKFNEIRS
jgi:hypothetical protein